MSDNEKNLGDVAVAAKSAPKSPKKSIRERLAAAPKGRTVVIVPDDAYEKREAVEALQAELQDMPKDALPRFLTSLNLGRIDGTFQVFTAALSVPSRRNTERKLVLSEPVKCGDHLVEHQSEDIGEDIDFGLQPQAVLVLDQGKIVDALQKKTADAHKSAHWRVRLADGVVSLKNT